MAVHGASDGLVLAGAVPVLGMIAPVFWLCSDSGEYLPLTRLIGAPPTPWSVKPPGCSPRLMVAGAPPVFFTVTVCVVCPCQATVLVMVPGVTVTRPALRVKFTLFATCCAMF